MTDNVPDFHFSEDEIAKIKAELGAVDVDESQPQPINEIRPKRKPGRPRKNPLPATEPESVSPVSFPPAQLTKRDEREVAERLANILSGTTGMAGMVKPYLPMTDEEAKAIAEPLASYLIRNEPTQGIAREILENYDLLAIVLGVGSYTLRVYSDRKSELQSKRPDNNATMERVSDVQASNNGRRPYEGVGDIVGAPPLSVSGSIPNDI